VSGVVRRVVRARTLDDELAQDVAQETVVRLAGTEARLDDDALVAYAIVTARHLVVDHRQAEAQRVRRQHRLVAAPTFEGPEEVTLLREETEAMTHALGRLPAADRRLLVAHEAEGTELEALAKAAGTNRNAVAVRLARARAVLRLEYLLAFRHVELPTSHCRAVLLSLSAGDKRRQETLDAAGHLLQCSVCASLSQPLLERRRAFVGWIMLLGALEAMRRFVTGGTRGRRMAIAAGAAVIVTATVVTVIAARTSGDRLPRALQTPTTEVALTGTVPTTGQSTTGPPSSIPPEPNPSPSPSAAPATAPLAARPAETTPATEAGAADATVTAAPPSTDPPGETSPPAERAAVAAFVVAGNSLPPSADLSAYETQTITGENLEVTGLSVTLGVEVTGGGVTVWVRLATGGIPLPGVVVGQRVDVRGVVRTPPSTTDAAGPEVIADVASAAGPRAVYIEVSPGGIVPSRTSGS
jgi:RNA polymerase sigma factor (sigma-70 family)